MQKAFEGGGRWKRTGESLPGLEVPNIALSQRYQRRQEQETNQVKSERRKRKQRGKEPRKGSATQAQTLFFKCH